MPFSFAKRLWRSRFNRSICRPQRARVALDLEPLEERWLPNATIITVTTAADDLTTPIAGQTTLRDAINQANQTTGDTIEFAPSLSGQTIQPTAPLPAITGEGTTIDGVGMNITLDGSNGSPLNYPLPGYDVPPSGLVVMTSNVTIEGLIIKKWSAEGIEVVATSNNSVSNTNISNNDIENNGYGAGGGGVGVFPWNDPAGPGSYFTTNVNIVGNTISGNMGDGVQILGSQNEVKGNDIYGNQGKGVEIFGGSQNTIQNNSIFGNGVLGILLDGNANNSVTSPVLTSVVYGGKGTLTTVTIDGNLTLPNNAPSGVYTLEFFANTSSTNPQGENVLGTVKVMASGGAITPFTFSYIFDTIPAGGFTATVTDPNGNTSEFSNALPATPTTPPQSPPASAPATPPSFIQAAITLFIDGAELLIDRIEGYGNPNLAGVNADIALNLPCTRPFQPVPCICPCESSR